MSDYNDPCKISGFSVAGEFMILVFLRMVL